MQTDAGAFFVLAADGGRDVVGRADDRLGGGIARVGEPVRDVGPRQPGQDPGVVARTRDECDVVDGDERERDLTLLRTGDVGRAVEGADDLRLLLARVLEHGVGAVPARSGDVGVLLDRVEVDVRAGERRASVAQGVGARVDVGLGRSSDIQVRPGPEARKGGGEGPTLGGAVRAVLGTVEEDRRALAVEHQRAVAVDEDRRVHRARGSGPDGVVDRSGDVGHGTGHRGRRRGRRRVARVGGAATELADDHHDGDDEDHQSDRQPGDHRSAEPSGSGLLSGPGTGPRRVAALRSPAFAVSGPRLTRGGLCRDRAALSLGAFLRTCALVASGRCGRRLRLVAAGRGLLLFLGHNSGGLRFVDGRAGSGRSGPRPLLRRRVIRLPGQMGSGRPHQGIGGRASA